jgi:hypothetical protein
MIPTALAHVNPTLHIHPETMALAAAAVILALVAWRTVQGRSRS